MNKKEECKKCGGGMKRGIYLAQTISYESMREIKRLEASGSSRVLTVWSGGPGKIQPCLKCSRCGWSKQED